ncbi:hypothetical protein BVC71_04800 [Marivivens niveibacter]|uniref:MHYT domain-containing protein n=1 Tax=Marivivens niveibacter TaxID=1930667 RepID=A0A251X3S3_9RHOB|nr:MHYT domain-containing protein [Marivivens niveibacter]OUD10803.1 hypothetical protein BVC71_04800 [Marivivens niveibacter]
MLEHIRILLPGQTLSSTMEGQYNLNLVPLSLMLSIVGSYVALEIAYKLRKSERFDERSKWLWTGAVALGVGAWSMHFVGMNAFKLPEPIYYNPWVTLLSLAPVILASRLAIGIISSKNQSVITTLSGGVLFGAGIGVMHYVGMAGMLTNAYMYFRVEIVLLSVLIVVILATIALSSRQIIDAVLGKQSGMLPIFLGAVLMGGAIASMHFIAMKATLYYADETCADWVQLSDDSSIVLSLGMPIVSILLGLMVVVVAEISPKARATKTA